MINQHDLNKRQYKNKAENYLNSQTHSQGSEFYKFIEEIKLRQSKIILDLGCGGGHVSYNIAEHVNHIIAYDLSDDMLDIVSKTSKNLGIENINIQQGFAEDLPFNNNQFDMVISRYSAHHWQHVPTAMQEINRVLKPNGIAIFVDIVSCSSSILDTFLQAIEVIRDPSHVRDYSIKEWIYFIEDAGFQLIKLEKQSLALDFNSWVKRMHTPDEQIKTIRYLQNSASDYVKHSFNIQSDGSFETTVGYFVFQKNF